MRLRIPTLLFVCLLGKSLAVPVRSTSTVVASLVLSSHSSTSPPPATIQNNVAPPYPIHSSCNTTLQRQLSRALWETVELAQHAYDHLLREGQESPFFKKYFGNSTTAPVLGWFARVASADRGHMTFRCDDPDRNCATQEGKSFISCFPDPSKLDFNDNQSDRLGWTLAWRECHSRNGHLSTVICSSPVA